MSKADRRKWDGRYAERSGPLYDPEPWLVAHADALVPGRVLDVASGDGRNALFLARRGFRVTALDISPVGLARLRAQAREQGLEVDTVAVDLDEPAMLESLGPFDDLVVVRYRPSPAQWRALVPRLRPGGVLLLCSFGRERAKAGFDPAFCLDEGELRTVLEPALDCLIYERLGPAADWLEGSIWRRRP